MAKKTKHKFAVITWHGDKMTMNVFDEEINTTEKAIKETKLHGQLRHNDVWQIIQIRSPKMIQQEVVSTQTVMFDEQMLPKTEVYPELEE